MTGFNVPLTPFGEGRRAREAEEAIRDFGLIADPSQDPIFSELFLRILDDRDETSSYHDHNVRDRVFQDCAVNCIHGVRLCSILQQSAAWCRLSVKTCRTRLVSSELGGICLITIIGVLLQFKAVGNDPLQWRRLSIASDQGSDVMAAWSYAAFKLKRCIDQIGDLSHAVYNDIKASR